MRVSELNLMNNILTVVLNEPAYKLDRLRLRIQNIQDKGKGFEIDLKEHEEKRSGAANRYMWHLCTELAGKMSSKDVKYTAVDIYKKAIREAGVVSEATIKKKALKSFQQIWNGCGVGWFSEVAYEHSDGECVDLWLYHGSSSYDAAQMRQLLNYLAEDCREMGIETMAEKDIRVMLEYFANEEHNSDGK